MQQQGKGLETLGTVLAVAGWTVAAFLGLMMLVSFFVGLGARDPALIVGVALSAAGGTVGALALAGLGHLLRAVAQLGRNVHRLAAMVAAQQRPPN